MEFKKIIKTFFHIYLLILYFLLELLNVKYNINKK